MHFMIKKLHHLGGKVKAKEGLIIKCKLFCKSMTPKSRQNDRMRGGVDYQV